MSLVLTGSVTSSIPEVDRFLSAQFLSFCLSYQVGINSVMKQCVCARLECQESSPKELHIVMHTQKRSAVWINIFKLKT